MGKKTAKSQTNDAEGANLYMTMTVADQLLGIPALMVEDIMAKRGKANAVDLRQRLNFPPRSRRAPTPIHVVVDHNSAPYGLVVDSLGEVMDLDIRTLEPLPETLHPDVSDIATGVHRVHGRLLVVVDVARILGGGSASA